MWVFMVTGRERRFGWLKGGTWFCNLFFDSWVFRGFRGKSGVEKIVY